MQGRLAVRVLASMQVVLSLSSKHCVPPTASVSLPAKLTQQAPQHRSLPRLPPQEGVDLLHPFLCIISLKLLDLDARVELVLLIVVLQEEQGVVLIRRSDIQAALATAPIAAFLIMSAGMHVVQKVVAVFDQPAYPDLQGLYYHFCLQDIVSGSVIFARVDLDEVN